MSEPTINVSVILHGLMDESLGRMDFQLPLQVIAEHAADPDKLNALVQDELMPEAVQATLEAHLGSIPEHLHQAEMGRIHRASMKLFVNDDGEAMEFEMQFGG